MGRRKKVLIAILFVLIIIQFIRPGRNQNGKVLATDIANTHDVPQDVLVIFQSACYDCHSNNTRYPWYDKVQPFAWLLNMHIKKGKADLNFSDFGSYSARRQQSKFKSIASQVEDGEMPLASYKLMHKDARLTSEEKTLIINWAKQASEILNKKTHNEKN